MNDLADARELVRTGDYDSLELLYDDIPDTLSQLILFLHTTILEVLLMYEDKYSSCLQSGYSPS